ncbi:hypothetical protein PPRY_a2951 [Pseudoalteromonas prydzensis ACAM 620]|nr:hypothetical protein [Pseudoalteromonas prydzensis ACAM 620]
MTTYSNSLPCNYFFIINSVKRSNLKKQQQQVLVEKINTLTLEPDSKTINVILYIGEL